MTQEERECNAAIRRAARRGRVIVVEARTRDAETGRLIGGAAMNALIRGKAGRRQDTDASERDPEGEQA